MHKKNNRAFVNQILIYTLVMIGLSGTIGLGTVWMRHQISLSANSAKVLSARLKEVDRRISETKASIETEQDPAMLKLRNSEWRLGLMPTREMQVQRVTEDPVLAFAASRNRGLYEDRAQLVTFQVALRGR